MERIRLPEAGHPAGAQVGRRATSWSELQPELQERVAEHLSANDAACILRLLNKAAAKLFRGAVRVRLSEPVPPHAFVWRWGSPAPYRSLTLKSRKQLMALTAASGVLSNLQVAVAAAGCWPDSLALTSAAAGGHLHICEWLAEPLGPGWRSAVGAAASKGHIALMRWLLSRCPEAVCEAWTGAARAGRRDVCEALLADACPNLGVLLSAVHKGAVHGYMDMVQWLLSLPQLQKHWRKDKMVADSLLHAAAYGCDLAGLQCMYDTLLQLGGLPPLDGLVHPLRGALYSPTPDWRAKVDWLRARGYALNYERNSVLNLRLPDTLQPSDCVERARLFVQLLPEGVRAMEGPMCVVIGNGFCLAAPELVDFALEQWPVLARKCLADLRVEHWAKTPAHMMIAARLAARGAPFWPKVIQAAIHTGSLQMLQWMAAGAEADDPAGAAIDESRMAQLEELSGAGPEVRAAAAAALRAALEHWGADLATSAAEAGNLEMMMWLRAHGCAWDRTAFTEAAEAGNVALLEWMAEEGCPMPTGGNCYQYAIINQDLAVLQCLRRLGLLWGPRERGLLGCAVRNGCRVELLAWLLEAGCAVDWEAARRAASVPGCTPGVRAFIEQSAP